MVRARRVSTAVSNGRVSRSTWASRSPPWSVASRVVARSSGSTPDGGFPSAWRGRGVTRRELTNERAKWAAPLCFGALRCGDHHVPPGFDSVRAAERVPLVIDDGAGLVVDDRLYEFVLVGGGGVQLGS